MVRLIASAVAIAGLASPGAAGADGAAARADTRYLAFQMFVGGMAPEPAPDGGPLRLSPMPGPAALEAMAATLVAGIGTTGNARQRLGVIYGPLALDHSDADIGAAIAAGFDIALKHDVAVGFHVDDSMFWGGRSDLLAEPGNIERAGWDGPLATGRRLDWGPQPTQAPPQLCFGAPGVTAAVVERGGVIGEAVAAGLGRLEEAGRPDLFAGVIVGWETQIGRDFATGAALGYCALAHRGLGSHDPPEALDAGRAEAVADFITLWADSVAAKGVPRDRLYSHVAFVTRADPGGSGGGVRPYLERANFAPPEAAFGPGRRAGFSTYPHSTMFAELNAAVAGHEGRWASAEGANVVLAGEPQPSGLTPETYLARLFNRGAALVTIFGWGVGGPENGFRRAAEEPEALAAYRAFLSGAPLVESPARPSILERLPAKIRRIHAELPDWVRRERAQAFAQPLVEALDAALKANDLAAAEAKADALLALLEGRSAAPR